MSDDAAKQAKKLRESSLEENFARLDDVLEQLEDDDIFLEDAFKAYREGMAVLKVCSEQIDRVEKQVLKLTQEGRLEESV